MLPRQALLAVALFLCYIVTVLAGNREYYDILGVSPQATQQEIKRAFRRLSQKHHPDVSKEKDAVEKFQKINNAYEALSDPEKRRKYDQYGEEGLKETGDGGMHGFDDIFGQFFGGGGRQRGEAKGPELFVKIKVRLEDIYNGEDVDIFLTKQVLCPHCRGTGADNPDDLQTCPDCKGQGRIIRRQQIAPGFYQQFQTSCDRCGGKGKIFGTTCHVCSGSKVVDSMDEITLFIEKGIPDRHTIRFPHGGHEFPDRSASDIVFQIITVPHPIFERKGNDLHTKISLTLEEALLGFKREIKHLDNHIVTITRNTVTQPGEVEKIVGEGMPQHEYSSNFGDLYVEYKVLFPESFTPEQLALWRELFPSK